MSARTVSGPLGFALVALSLSGVAAGAMLALAVPDDAIAVRWAVTGWGLMAIVGLGGGLGLLRFHGRPAHGFVVVIGASLLARLGLAALGAWGAASAGAHAIVPYLIGLAAGYLPLQVLEVGWILGRTRTA